MIKKIFLTGLILSFALYCSGCATYRKHPDFDKRHKDIKTVSVVEPDVEVYKLTFKGDREMMMELLEPLVMVSKDEAERIFREKGYTVNKLDLSKEALKKDPELKSILFNVRELFKKRLDDIAKRKSKKFTYSLGADINDLSNISDSDVLIFIKESAVKKGGGEIAKDVTKSIVVAVATLGAFVPFYATCWCTIQVAVVDGYTGDILWYNHNAGTAQGLDAAHTKAIKKAIYGLFKPFPSIAKEAKEAKKIIPETVSPVAPTTPVGETPVVTGAGGSS